MGVAWSGSNGGADWELALASDRLLPGRLAEGRVSVVATRAIDARALVVTLRGEEKWRYNVSDGKTTTIHTGTEDQPPVAVVVSGPLRLAVGESRAFAVSLPVPPLGPATLDGREASMTWTLEAKLDIPNGTDSALEVPVRLVQPVALLRAGVVHVGEFALYEDADAHGGGVAGAVELDPVPLVAGEPFRGRLVLQPSGPMDLEEVRVEVRVRVESTVGGGRNETITPFAAAVSGPLRLDGEHVLGLAGTLEDLALPTTELPHGKASAQVHVILARRLARDPHLVRDVAIATTSEL
jgi:hypothetical protein